MPLHLLNPIASTSRRVALCALLIISIAMSFGGLADARQADPTPTPEIGNLPAGVEVVLGATLDLEAGDYQWHVSEMTSSMPGDAPMPVHRGVLFAASGPVLVSHDGAALDQVTTGQALVLTEGENILPLSMTTTPVDLVLVELVPILAPATPEPSETAGYQEPMTIAQGSYVIALLYLPSSDQNDAATETIVTGAAAPIAEVTLASDAATPEVANRERWIVALFAPGAVEATTGQDAGSDGSAPTGTSTAMATSSITTATPTTTATATASATMTPVATAPPSGSGSGSGSTTFDPSRPVLGLADDDNDGLTNDGEAAYGTDRLNPDSDGDSYSDGWEVDYGTDPTNADTDGDTLSDYAELDIYGTDPLVGDSDGDGLIDGREVNAYGTNPLAKDSDGDGLRDDEELFTYGTEPRVADTDGDGLKDYSEIFAVGSDPLVADTDGDGLMDGEEGAYGANPLRVDTDGDGVNDYDEVQAGTDPLIP